MDRILEENSNTEEFSSERYCNGIAGVPITFLDKYSPEQFEIVNANDYRKTENVPVKSHGLIKDKDASITLSESKKEMQKSIDKKDSKNIIAKSRSRAEQSRAEQSRAEADCLRYRICIRKKL
ncbi:MAG: adenine-specific methyltransferase EcoRI family protein [Anaerobutyricum sp.]